MNGVNRKMATDAVLLCADYPFGLNCRAMATRRFMAGWL
jgi:hypothetical protein